ncbi:Hydroxymethylpyrimidine/phosphomethylpyrimidine kinase [Desulfovibrionales bacterium]
MPHTSMAATLSAYTSLPPTILTIAGSDSGGGAGIQADLKTIAALGGYGLTVITALTAQNGLGVAGIHATPPEFAALQLATVMAGFPIATAKIGMLFSAPIIDAIADGLANKPFPLVIDPVAVSQSGHRLIQDDAVATLKTRMLPLADLVTPNRLEAELFTGRPITDSADIAPAITALLDLGAQAILLKGGHFCDDKETATTITDWLGLPGRPPLPLPHYRMATLHTHGTGCTLSTAIACGLGWGLTLEAAVRQAQHYLNCCLATGYAPGQGFGPPDHMAPFAGLLPRRSGA